MFKLANPSEIIRGFSSVLIAAAVAFGAYWTWWIISGHSKLLTSKAHWLQYSIVEDHAEVPFYAMAGMWAIFLLILLCGWFALGAGIRLMWLYRQGDYFTPQSTFAVFLVGLGLILAMVADTIYAALDHFFLTLSNTVVNYEFIEGDLPLIWPRYELDLTDISLTLCGLGFCLIGFVLQVAHKQAVELKEFV